MKNICERLLVKPVQISAELPFFDTCTSGSNWSICFSFCIIIYGFVYQFSLHYYWYYYHQQHSSGGVLQKRCSYKFRNIHKRTPALKTRFYWSCRSTELITLSKKRFGHRCFLANSRKSLLTLFSKSPSYGCFCISTRFFYCSTTTFCFFKKRWHIYFPAECFLGVIYRLGIRVSSIFQTSRVFCCSLGPTF